MRRTYLPTSGNLQMIDTTAFARQRTIKNMQEPEEWKNRARIAAWAIVVGVLTQTTLRYAFRLI